MKPILPLIPLFISLLVSGCLKTRAQVTPEREGQKSDEREVAGNENQGTDSDALDGFKSEINRLAGRVEELERDQKQSTRPEEFKKIENRILELERAQLEMIEAIKKLEDAQKKETEQRQVNSNPSDAYEKGKKQFEVKNYPGAIEQFTLYLKTPKPKRGEEARFLRGEAHFHSKDWSAAIDDFSVVTQKNPKSKYGAHSTYRMAQCFENKGMKEEAKLFYQELKDKFPNSPEAKKAAKK